MINANDRSAYQSTSILAKGVTLSNDTWQTGLNCNQLVLGPSGSGKTRYFLKPNLLQANASFLVLDTKGLLYREVGPVLERLGYDVQMLNFAEVGGTVGYDPLDFITRDPITGQLAEYDIIKMAQALCPVECGIEPFWDHAAANYLSIFISVVLETYPPEEQSFDHVISLFEDIAQNAELLKQFFYSLESTHPDCFALRLYHRVCGSIKADKMHASIVGIIAEKLLCLGFKEAFALYHNPHKVDFAAMGHR